MTAIFPALPGLGWDVQHDFDWTGNNVIESVSGQRSAIGTRIYPRHRWTLAYNFLRVNPAEYQALVGLYNACNGMFGIFLYQDATDNAVTGQVIGTGDGTKTAFPMIRSWASFVEPVLAPHTVSKVYLDGVNQTSGWSVSAYGTATPGVLTFTSAPAAGKVITADFSFYFPCRFDSPTLSVKAIYSGIYSADTVVFSSEF